MQDVISLYGVYDSVYENGGYPCGSFNFDQYLMLQYQYNQGYINAIDVNGFNELNFCFINITEDYCPNNCTTTNISITFINATGSMNGTLLGSIYYIYSLDIVGSPDLEGTWDSNIVSDGTVFINIEYTDITDCFEIIPETNSLAVCKLPTDCNQMVNGQPCVYDVPDNCKLCGITGCFVDNTCFGDYYCYSSETGFNNQCQNEILVESLTGTPTPEPLGTLTDNPPNPLNPSGPDDTYTCDITGCNENIAPTPIPPGLPWYIYLIIALGSVAVITGIIIGIVCATKKKSPAEKIPKTRPEKKQEEDDDVVIPILPDDSADPDPDPEPEPEKPKRKPNQRQSTKVDYTLNVSDLDMSLKLSETKDLSDVEADKKVLGLYNARFRKQPALVRVTTAMEIVALQKCKKKNNQRSYHYCFHQST